MFATDPGTEAFRGGNVSVSKRLFLTARVILFFGLMTATGRTASGQIATDGRGTAHIFPQFVDGFIEGSRVSYTSALIVSATNFAASTSCSLRLIGMRDLTMTDARRTSAVGTDFSFVLEPGGWQVMSSSSGQILASGSARLDCDQVVNAQLRYTSKLGGRVISEATASSASPGTQLQILADHRDGARVAVAVTNPYDIDADYAISVIDVDGMNVGTIVVRLAPKTSLPNFVDEFVPIPPDHVGLILVQSNTPGA